MKNEIKRLGDAELEIMQVIWSAEKPIMAARILELLQEKRKWALSTLMTSLARLAEKGFVFCDRTHRNNQYTALISEEDYKRKESKNFLERLYGNSLQGLVATLYHDKSISEEDIIELRSFLDKLEKGEDGCRNRFF